jgi:hypothetical protein
MPQEELMTARARISFALLWFASLVVIGVLAAAQTRREPGAVISGDNIGFRPEGWNGKSRTGTFVVRVNGEWVEAQSVMKTVPGTR